MKVVRALQQAKPPAHTSPYQLRSDKVQPHHLDRLAVVYVRQSTAQQVLDHQESTRLQYGLTSSAQGLGWPADRVVVIDDDLGKSGASAEGRAGFQRLVSEVSLDHVGIILGIEMSRLARSCKDWHQLLELCALFGTLIADLDGIYDPAQYNDRLLLGLKGTMSEAESHILKQRMLQGRLNKARRGELALLLPSGYVRRPSAEVSFDPDEQVQGVIRLIFRKFEELGNVYALLHYLVKHDIRLGMRAQERLGKGELQWRRPNRTTLYHILTNPVYAGAYAYGRRQVDPRRKRAHQPASGRICVDPRGWLAFQKDCLPAYISWERYEQNLARLKANRARAEERGAVRHGPALLTGLLVCGKCGQRMNVCYGGAENRPSYVCNKGLTSYGIARCQGVTAWVLDRYVSGWVLAALEPAALELSLEAATHLEREREDLVRLWQRRLERAAYEAERAGRAYRLVEPENRLVGRQLEREWEERLAAQQRLAEEHRRFLKEQPRALSAAEREAIRALAANIPALWTAETTTVVERKEIIRQIVDRVVVEAYGASERVAVVIEWIGGARTAGEVIRPVGHFRRLSYYPELCQRVAVLAEEGLLAGEIAERLNAEGYRPPKCREQFNRTGVSALLRQLNLAEKRAMWRQQDGPGEHEWRRDDLARELEMPEGTLYAWIGRGWVKARRQKWLPRRWFIWADEGELERLRELRKEALSYPRGRVSVGPPSRPSPSDSSTRR